MSKKLAITTTDRLTIHKHFGHADEFHIAEVSDDGFEWIDVRKVDEACKEGGHEEAGFDRVLEAIKDC
ncbi:MAG: hypothetical protein LBN22_09200, partial [Clostridiales Family XIII bacterium]|nr:hypothetical protein [Clostridiales Family XIII bacterium]